MPDHRVLYDESAIAARVAELASAIHRDLPPGPTPVVLGLLTGSFVFVADLIRAASRLGVEPIVDFMAVSHYGSTTRSTGVVRVYKDAVADLRGRSVLLVDDILDTGHTLKLVRDHLAEREPLWLRTCVLLDKPARRVADIQADYVGFEVPDIWIVGYGLDAGERGRSLPYLAALDPDGDPQGKR